MSIRTYGRSWGVYDRAGALVCVCLDKKGAAEVVRRLAGRSRGPPGPPQGLRAFVVLGWSQDALPPRRVFPVRA